MVYLKHIYLLYRSDDLGKNSQINDYAVQPIKVKWDIKTYDKFDAISKYLKNKSKSHWILCQVLFVRAVVLVVTALAIYFLYTKFIVAIYSQDHRKVS